MRYIIVSIFLILAFPGYPAMGEAITVTDTLNRTFGRSPFSDDARISVFMPDGLHGGPVRVCVGPRPSAGLGAVPVS